MTFNNPKQQSGFSLIEVLVAFTVVAIGVLGLVKMQTFLERKSEYARMGLVAIQIAENELELIRSASYTSISDSSATVSRGGDTYSWQLISKSAMSGNAKRVEVTVNWTDNWAQSHSLSLTTLRSKF